MGHVSLTLNGKVYKLACEDGDEQRLQALAAHVSAKLESLGREFGQIGDAKLFLMSALLIADELFEVRDKAVDVSLTALKVVNKSDGPQSGGGQQKSGSS
jgi:cell division protein ZapA